MPTSPAPAAGILRFLDLLHELCAWRDYAAGDELSFWRSASGFEVDLRQGDHTAVELKAKPSVSGSDLRSLRALAEERVFKRCLCVSLEPRARRVGGITVLPWAKFLEALWAGEYR